MIIFDLRHTIYARWALKNRKSQIINRKLKNARVTTADAEQTAVAAFLPWRGS
jgi:hypothetical protein